MTSFTRAFPLEDCSIRSGGDGRTVEAYAAVFGSTAPVSDQDGNYLERIAPGAFDATLTKHGTRFGVLFNHGLTIYGTPSDRGSMPIGTPLEVRADARGLYTVTRYNATPLADEALEGIRSGSITAQSFQGRFVASDIKPPRGGFRPNPDGSLRTVTRTEIALKEYGPAVFAVYPDAAIVGVRAAAAGLTLDVGQTALLELILESLTAADAGLDPIVEALCAADFALDTAQLVLSQILGVANPDPMDGEPMAADAGDRALTAHLKTLATRLDAVQVRNAGDGAGTAPEQTLHVGHSERLSKPISVTKALRSLGL